MVSLSLACGTTIGWQRIVKTIGERIGKEHLTYAQGASSELVAAAMIGLSTQSGLPTSTTHVLTSSIAGSMVASRGVKNINPEMVRSIALAWVLTLPVTMVLAGGLFLLFRSISG
jgi:PiT family inorganic phosphate transporter